MTSWAGFWLGLALIVSTAFVARWLTDAGNAGWWPAPPPTVYYTPCPTAAGC